MAKCTAKTANGGPCQAQAIRGSNLCFTHNPERAAARSKARQLGGHRRRVGHAGDTTQLPERVRTVADVLTVLDYTLSETLRSENSIARGRLLVALCAAFVEAIQMADLETRVDAALLQHAKLAGGIRNAQA